MNEPKVMTLAGVLAFAALLLGLPLVARAETGSISGTMLALDKKAGTITVGEIGPWRGKTEITRRTITVTAATEFWQVRRAAGPGPTGWAGEYVETRLGAWDVKPGDFVTARIQREAGRLRALKIEVAVPEP